MGIELSDHQLAVLVSLLDKNNDGLIDYEEM